jgi:hypothetical protein
LASKRFTGPSWSSPVHQQRIALVSGVKIKRPFKQCFEFEQKWITRIETVLKRLPNLLAHEHTAGLKIFELLLDWGKSRVKKPGHFSRVTLFPRKDENEYAFSVGGSKNRL